MADKIHNVRVRYVVEGEDLVKAERLLKNLSEEDQNLIKSFREVNAEASKAGSTVKNNVRSIEELQKEYQQLKTVSKNAFDVNQLKAYQAQMDKLEAEAKQLGTSLKNASDKGKKSFLDLDSAGKKVGGAIAGYFAVSSIIQAGKAIIDTTAQFQKFEAVLVNTLGSKSDAQQALHDIKDFAASTPFAVSELTESYVKLANQGFKPTSDEMRKLGDLAASTGKSFDQLTEAVIDAQTGEFERLKEFGIRASKEGDKVKFTFKGVEQQVNFTGDAIRKYVLSLGNVAGVSGSMAAISRTLGGQLSNLGDSFDALQVALGERFKSAISSGISAIADLVTSFKEFVEVPVSEKLQEEQSELNVLVGAITDANVSQEVRNQLIAELQSKYPDFLANLNAETVTNEQLNQRLKDVNDEYFRKIVLQKQDEKYKEQLGEQKDAFDNLYDAQKNLSSAIQEVNKYTKLQKQENESNLQFASRMVDALNKQLLADPKLTSQLQVAMANLSRAQKAYNEEEKKSSDILKENIQIEKDLTKTKELDLETRRKLVNETVNAIEAAEKEKQKTEDAANSISAYRDKIKELTEEKEKQTNITDIKKLASLDAEIDRYKKLIKDVEDRLQAERRLRELRNEPIAGEIDATLKEPDITKVTKEEADKRHKIRLDEMKKAKKEVFDPLIRANKAAEEAQTAEDVKQALLRQQVKQQSAQKILEIGIAASDLVFQNEAQKNLQALADIQERKDKELKLAGDNAQARAFIEKKFSDEEKRIKIQQAQQDKNKAIFDIGIQTGVAIVKQLAATPLPIGAPLVALIAAMGAIQLAAVVSRPIPKFNKGTKYVPGVDVGNRDSVLANLTVGEAVIPREQNKKYAPIVSGIIDGTLDHNLVPKLNYAKFEKEGYGVRQDFAGMEKQLKEIKGVLQTLPVTKVNIDKKGLQTYIETGVSQTEFLNNYFQS